MAEAAVQNVTTTHRVKKKTSFFQCSKQHITPYKVFFLLAPAIYRNMDVLPNISKFEEGSHLTRRSKFCAKKTFWGSLIWVAQVERSVVSKNRYADWTDDLTKRFTSF